MSVLGCVLGRVLGDVLGGTSHCGAPDSGNRRITSRGEQLIRRSAGTPEYRRSVFRDDSYRRIVR